MKPEPVQWWCPVCQRVLRRPPYRLMGELWHSSHCGLPMRPVRVSLVNKQGEQR